MTKSYKITFTTRPVTLQDKFYTYWNIALHGDIFNMSPTIYPAFGSVPSEIAYAVDIEELPSEEDLISNYDEQAIKEEEFNENNIGDFSCENPTNEGDPF